MTPLFLLLLQGCVENVIKQMRERNEDVDSAVLNDSADSQPESEPNEPDAGQPDPPEPDDPEPDFPEPDPSEPDDPPEIPGDSLSNPRTPLVGEIVINEMMIDPEAVYDRDGEWIELYNLTNDWLDITGYYLVDLGADAFQIASPSDLILSPNGYVLICANDSYWDNGGITCDATFDWSSFGGGFNLSNGEDEVVLASPQSVVIDAVFYVSGFAVEGASLGVTPSSASYSGNDDLSKWCDQWGFLPQGDSGSPGSMNDYCF